MSSNSFGQNKIGHKFCLPKTDPSNSRRITCAKANLLCSKLATCTHGIGKYRYDMKLTTNQNTRERKALYKLRCHKSTNLSEAIAAVRITTNIYSEYYTYNILYIYIYIYIQLCSAIGLNSAVSFLPQLTAARSGKFNWSSGIFLFGKFCQQLEQSLDSFHSTSLFQRQRKSSMRFAFASLMFV